MLHGLLPEVRHQNEIDFMEGSRLNQCPNIYSGRQSGNIIYFCFSGKDFQARPVTGPKPWFKASRCGQANRRKSFEKKNGANAGLLEWFADETAYLIKTLTTNHLEDYEYAY